MLDFHGKNRLRFVLHLVYFGFQLSFPWISVCTLPCTFKWVFCLNHLFDFERYGRTRFEWFDRAMRIKFVKREHYQFRDVNQAISEFGKCRNLHQLVFVIVIFWSLLVYNFAYFADSWIVIFLSSFFTIKIFSSSQCVFGYLSVQTNFWIRKESFTSTWK